MLFNFYCQKEPPFDKVTTCRESSNVPEYFAILREGGEAPKVVVHFRIRKRYSKLLFYFGIIRKRDSNFFAASIGLRIETTDFCLIRARKMTQLVGSDRGSDRSKQKPCQITRLAIGKVNSGHDPRAGGVAS
jgi:hypothetical protein